MDTIDPNTAKQVWNRVAAAPAQAISPTDLYSLIFAAGETAALYRSLSASLSGKQRDSALVLLNTQQDTLNVLRGMQIKSFGKTTKNIPEPKLPPRRLLEKCYQNARTALTEYTARTIGVEYGPVFRQLAAREEGNCLRILSLLGQK